MRQSAVLILLSVSLSLSLFFFFCFFSLFFSWKRKRKEDYVNLIIIMYNIKKTARYKFMTLETGITNRKEVMVTPENVAGNVGSGEIDVFATPEMINLMEHCASEGIAPYLEPGKTTVGITVKVSHLSATPIGMKVWCESTLTAIDGKKLSFEVRAYDDKGLIGEGTHERFIVDTEKFMARAMAKLEG